MLLMLAHSTLGISREICGRFDQKHAQFCHYCVWLVLAAMIICMGYGCIRLPELFK
jgi:hypothetical protein